ncbi:gamma-glutamyltransferase [Cupriavidus plantarum]|uniref:Glutathione hydrolase proenzyme n=1 Tax=Cupriavidus plantarum TaxID=942865 RepID=A0A316F0L8_9BURK|nr:gamma-glutamyltransferase [Cupriavidus plantarum]NYH98169.1 gamma-glutamyltranspeptidase/glutathione hydrolase [Cupriavidus plantarum]PWK38201.1 gamma-glutamyltransferase 2 [Cupriavidus plantarum]REE91852.1 gamma-glutamyltransferase 2 [Cupriavidus plantarum]RLK35402.1 gamma-glutamyltransferase 2 [Cupriavidus plantarum]CAG2127605.1 Glutathione hydrolase-like YwrD proenzyme [Cupriavidus plantarum]
MQNFNWTNPYPTVRIPLFARNTVSTSHPLAAQAGLRMLLKGGNAVDAAIAAAAAITLVEPVSCGLGSDAFAILWDGKELHGLNSSGVAPAAWNTDYYKGKYGEAANGIANRPIRGIDSVTVPGVVAGWAALHERFGKLPFEDLMEPAIEIAERGYAVPPVVAHKWAAAVPELRNQPGFADTFMPHGRAPEVGEKFVFKAAADTLRKIGATRGRSYYEGEIAEKIAAFSKEIGGAMTLDDLRNYRPDWVKPISKSYRGYDVHEIPPNGQGIAALMALGILDQFDVGALPVDSVQSQHLQIEAMKLAFADLYRYVADPRSMEVTPEQMLDDAYLKSRAKLIDMDRATNPNFGMPKAGGTIYLTAADENGMMISFIQSNYMGFGSGVVVPGTGISLQNRGVGFSMDPKSANVVAGGKRPFHTIIPAFLTRDGQPVMSFGVMGGDMQPQGHVQTVVRMLDYKQQPQAACDAPRWKVNRDFTLDVEGTMNADTVAALKARGHQLKSVEDPYMDFGSGQFIWRLSDDREQGYVVASDSRRDGQAVGF